MKVFPYVRYHARNDSRTRGEHAHLDGRIFRKYTDSASLLYAGHEVESVMIHEIWHLKSKNLFGDGVLEDKKTPQMRRRLEILNNTFGRAIKEENWISPHGGENPFEFFCEIKLMEKFDKPSLPQYIIEALKEIGNGGTW